MRDISSISSSLPDFRPSGRRRPANCRISGGTCVHGDQPQAEAQGQAEARARACAYAFTYSGRHAQEGKLCLQPSTRVCTTSPSAGHSAVRPCLCSGIMLYRVDRKTYPKMFACMYCVGVTGRRERIPCKPCRRTESSDDEDEGKDNDGASGQDRQGNSGCDAAGSAAKVGLSLSTKSSLGPSSLLPSRRPLCVHYPLLSTSIILLSTSTPNLLSLPHSSFSLRTPALYNAGNHPGQPQASKQIQVRSPKGW